MDAWAQCSSVRKLPQVILPSVILTGGIFCWKTRLLSINPHYPTGLRSSGGIVTEERGKRYLVGKRWLVFLMACQWQVVRRALESAGFSCVALSNVCQWLSEAEVESTEATASSSLPPFLSQNTTVTPAPDMLTLGASLGCPQSPKIKYEDLG